MPSKRANVYHNLYILLDAGLPTIRALKTTAAGLKGRLPRIFDDLAQAISAGRPLAEAMTKHPDLFPPLDIMMVEAADSAGNLPECFKLLSDWYAFRHRLITTALSGFLLPILVLNVAAFVPSLPSLILGQITLTQFLLFAIRTLAIFYTPAVLIFCIIHFTPPTGLPRKILDSVTLRIPVLGQAVRKMAISRYARAFHMLYKAGIPIVQSADKAAALTGNTVIADLFEGGAESARNGNAVVSGFSDKLPLDFLNIWQVGEETGSLDNVTRRIADNYADSAELLFTEFARWLPRLIYALICLLMIMTIFKMAGLITSSYSI